MAIESFFRNHPGARKLLTSVVPQETRQRVRVGLRNYNISHETYPDDPVTKVMDSMEVRFHIGNHTDAYRLLGDGFEEKFSRQIIDSINPDDIFFDIGAAQGLYSLFAARKGAQVLAFEPDPVSIASINANLGLNPNIAPRVRVLPYALGERNGTLSLHMDPRGRSSPSFVRTSNLLRKRVPVDVRTIDGLIDAGEIPHPNVVKIDVEGAEDMVLAGMERTLRSPYRPGHLLVELHPTFLPQLGASMDQVLGHISDMGYTTLEDDKPIVRANQQQMHFVPMR